MIRIDVYLELLFTVLRTMRTYQAETARFCCVRADFALHTHKKREKSKTSERKNKLIVVKFQVLAQRKRRFFRKYIIHSALQNGFYSNSEIFRNVVEQNKKKSTESMREKKYLQGLSFSSRCCCCCFHFNAFWCVSVIVCASLDLFSHFDEELTCVVRWRRTGFSFHWHYIHCMPCLSIHNGDTHNHTPFHGIHKINP